MSNILGYNELETRYDATSVGLLGPIGISTRDNGSGQAPGGLHQISKKKFSANREKISNCILNSAPVKRKVHSKAITQGEEPPCCNSLKVEWGEITELIS